MFALLILLAALPLVFIALIWPRAGYLCECGRHVGFDRDQTWAVCTGCGKGRKLRLWE
jgi:hypothetical protein